MLEAAHFVFAAFQLLPERAVGGSAGHGTLDELAVMLAHHFLARVTHGAREVVVDVEHLAIEVELDDGLGAVDGGDLAAIIRVLLVTRAQRALHVVQRREQLAGLVPRTGLDDVVQPALLDGVGHVHGLAQRTDDAASQEKGQEHTDHQRSEVGADESLAAAVIGGLALVAGFDEVLLLAVHEIHEGRHVRLEGRGGLRGVQLERFLAGLRILEQLGHARARLRVRGARRGGFLEQLAVFGFHDQLVELAERLFIGLGVGGHLFLELVHRVAVLAHQHHARRLRGVVARPDLHFHAEPGLLPFLFDNAVRRLIDL
jgi:hypothetical protein